MRKCKDRIRLTGIGATFYVEESSNANKINRARKIMYEYMFVFSLRKRLTNERTGYMHGTQHTQQTTTRTAQNQNIETI